MNRGAFFKNVDGAATLASLVNLFPKKSLAMPNKMTVAGLGDCILTRRVSLRQDKAFLDLVYMVPSAHCAWDWPCIPSVNPG